MPQNDTKTSKSILKHIFETFWVVLGGFENVNILHKNEHFD